MPVKYADESVTLLRFDRDQVGAYADSASALRAGVIIFLSGELVPGKTKVNIVAGHPIRDFISRVNPDLVRLGVIELSEYYDPRHAQFLGLRLMMEIAERRGLRPNEQRQDAIAQGDVPYGDIDRMHAIADWVFEAIDAELDYGLMARLDDALPEMVN